MLFEGTVFSKDWYTDSLAVYRSICVDSGNITKMERSLIRENIPCRIYSTRRNGPRMNQTAASVEAVDKVACDLGVDIKAGDELHIIRGGMLGIPGEPERYFAGRPHPYYDPVGGVLSGLEHQETALLTDEVIG